jgi:hypothetical protein
MVLSPRRSLNADQARSSRRASVTAIRARWRAGRGEDKRTVDNAPARSPHRPKVINLMEALKRRSRMRASDAQRGNDVDRCAGDYCAPLSANAVPIAPELNTALQHPASSRHGSAAVGAGTRCLAIGATGEEDGSRRIARRTVLKRVGVPTGVGVVTAADDPLPQSPAAVSGGSH